ncbi:MAG: alpha/beta fold hydrolase [Pseudomonadota bacterium]
MQPRARADVSYRFARFTLDLASGRVCDGDRELRLRPKAFELLRLLVEGGGRLHAKDELIQTLWPGVVASDDSLVQAVSDVRAALGEGASGIVVTVPRRGYRLGVAVEGPRAPGPPAEVRYALSGEVRIAYQVVGDGPVDLVYIPGWVSHLEYGWESPLVARFYQALAGFSRLILFDKRGTGLSDRAFGLPGIEQRMDDVRAVMDAAGSRRAALFSMSEGGAMAMAFAATHPERVRALALYGAFARRAWAPDYPWGPTREARQRFYDAIEREWGGPVGVDDLAPSLADDAAFRTWWAAFQRRSASPAAALALARMNTDADVRDLLPAIRAPTLVLHRSGDRDAHIDEGRYVAARIPDATFVELPGDDHMIYAGDMDAVIEAVRSFLSAAGGAGR